MPNFSEYPNQGKESLLSDILEIGDLPQKLFLKQRNLDRLVKTKFRKGLEIVFKPGSILECLTALGETYKVGFLLENLPPSNTKEPKDSQTNIPTSPTKKKMPHGD